MKRKGKFLGVTTCLHARGIKMPIIQLLTYVHKQRYNQPIVPLFKQEEYEPYESSKKKPSSVYAGRNSWERKATRSLKNKADRDVEG